MITYPIKQNYYKNSKNLEESTKMFISKLQFLVPTYKMNSRGLL